MYKKLLFILVFSIYCYSTQYNLQLYSTTFQYPTTWSVSSYTNSSVILKIGVDRLLRIEYLLDGPPGSYLDGKIHLLDSLNLNFRINGIGPVDIANHKGYYLSSSQANPSTFSSWHSCCYYARIAKFPAVLTIQYSNAISDASYWEEDVDQITTLISTINIADDVIPNQTKFDHHVSHGDMTIDYSDNLSYSDSGSTIHLLDNFDQVIDYSLKFSVYHRSDTIPFTKWVANYKKSIMQFDTFYMGSDSLNIIIDEFATDNKSASFQYYFGEHFTVYTRYCWMIELGDSTGLISFYQPKRTGNYNGLINAIIQHVDFSIQNMSINNSNFKHPPQNSYKINYHVVLPFAQRNNIGMCYDLQGRRLLTKSKLSANVIVKPLKQFHK